MRLLILTCILLNSSILLSQQDSSEVRLNEIVDKARKPGGNIAYDSLGRIEATRKWEEFKNLILNMDTDRLIELVKNTENSDVKIYSFESLVERKASEVFEIINQNILKEETVWLKQGCLISELRLGQFYLDIANPNVKYLGAYRLDSNQLETIHDLDLFKRENSFDLNINLLQRTVDSLMLFDDIDKDRDINEGMLRKLLDRIELNPSYYNRIKDFCIKGGSRLYLPALAKYQKEEDIDLIIAALEHPNVWSKQSGFRAIQYFPNEIFLPYVEEKHSSYFTISKGRHAAEIKYLYTYFVQLKNKRSIELMEQGLNISDEVTAKVHREYIREALDTYPDSVYDDLRDLLDLNEK